MRKRGKRKEIRSERGYKARMTGNKRTSKEKWK